jgi:hypothetical protein
MFANNRFLPKGIWVFECGMETWITINLYVSKTKKCI